MEQVVVMENLFHERWSGAQPTGASFFIIKIRIPESESSLSLSLSLSRRWSRSRGRAAMRSIDPSAVSWLFQDTTLRRPNPTHERRETLAPRKRHTAAPRGGGRRSISHAFDLKGSTRTEDRRLDSVKDSYPKIRRFFSLQYPSLQQARGTRASRPRRARTRRVT